MERKNKTNDTKEKGYIKQMVSEERKKSEILNQKDIVLIVDDYPDNLVFVSELLESNEIEVEFSSDGEEALRIAEEKKPSLILLDISMPKMDGYEVCRHLKSKPSTEHIPVVFLTAKIEPDDIIKGFESGGVDYITKPFNLMELLSRVKTHLEQKNKHQKLQLMNSKLIETVQKRSQQLSKANERLSKLDKAKNDFLIHINHQLRTPLNGIMGYSELLAQSDLNKEQGHLLKEITGLVKRLVKLSERSLLFTELRANTYRLNIEIVEAASVIEKSILVATGRYSDKNIYINNDITSNQFKVLADENLFFRCATIILDNAIKFSPDKGIIKICGEIQEDKKLIRIIDNGPGIQDKIKDKLFELFSIGNHDNINEHNGFGMGLATAKLIMDIQSAELKIRNIAEGGTEVTMIFYDWSGNR